MRGMGGEGSSASALAIEIVARLGALGRTSSSTRTRRRCCASCAAHGLRIGLVSNTSRDLAAFVRHVLARRRRLGRLGRPRQGQAEPDDLPRRARRCSRSRPVTPSWSATPSTTTSRARARSGCARSSSTARAGSPDDDGGAADLYALPAALGLAAEAAGARLDSFDADAGGHDSRSSPARASRRHARRRHASSGCSASAPSASPGRSRRWPPICRRSSATFTDSATLVGFVLSAEGVFAIVLPLLVGPLSDATRTPFGRRRPYMLLALVPDGRSRSPSSPSCTSLVGDGLRPLRLLLRLLHLRAAVPRPLPRPAARTTSSAALRVCSTSIRGAALGGALVGGGFLLRVWEPFPFVARRGGHGARLRGGGRPRAASRPLGRRRVRALPLLPRRALADRAAGDGRPALPDRQHGLGGDLRRHADVRRPLHHRGLDQPLYVSSTRARGRRGRLRGRRALLDGGLGDRFGIGQT